MNNKIFYPILLFSLISLRITYSDIIEPLKVLSDNLKELNQLIQSDHREKIEKIAKLETELEKIKKRLSEIDQQQQDIIENQIKIDKELTRSLKRLAAAKAARYELINSKKK